MIVLLAGMTACFTTYYHFVQQSNTIVADDGIIIEFKVQDDDEKDLADTVREALRQIEEKNYQADLEARGIPAKRIRRYGFAFCGKRVLIGSSLTSD